MDRVSNGAHDDMDIFTFMDSSSVLFPYFRHCALLGPAGTRPGAGRPVRQAALSGHGCRGCHAPGHGKRQYPQGGHLFPRHRLRRGGQAAGPAGKADPRRHQRHLRRHDLRRAGRVPERPAERAADQRPAAVRQRASTVHAAKRPAAFSSVLRYGLPSLGGNWRPARPSTGRGRSPSSG